MKNVMLDLETLGTAPGCPIVSIGAVAFCPNEGLGDRFYVEINPNSCRQAGLVPTTETIKWWTDQPGGVDFLKRVDSRGELLSVALTEFTHWLEKFGHAEVKVWGNGSDFDNAIIQYAYKAIGLEAPWKFWNNRCFRTLKDLLGAGRKMDRVGTHHNALDDAITQAKFAVAVMGTKGA